MQPRPQGLLVFQNGGGILENEKSLGTKLICMKSLLIGESLLTSLFTFFLIIIRLNS